MSPRALFDRVREASIWHPDAIPHDAAYLYVSPIKRVFLPAYDIVILWLGLAGLVRGFQAISAVFTSPIAILIYGLLALAGLTCLVACAFPRLWRVEVGGKIAILTILGMIAVSMTIAGLSSMTHTGITITPVVVGLILVPLLRLWTLGGELGDRKAKGLE